MSITIALAILIAALGPAQAEEKEVEYIPDHDDLCYNYGGCEPVMRIEPGTVIKSWTEDCYDGSVKSPGDLPSKIRKPFHSNPQTGPFYIEGAEPGDTIAVTILDLQPARSFGVSSFGNRTDLLSYLTLPPADPSASSERVWFYQVNPERGTVTYKAHDDGHSVEIPMKPFLGCIGVAPSAGEVRYSIVPGDFGGNMDTPELGVGATVYLGVNVPGALLSFGDGHLVQGGGEVIGTAVEAAMNVKLRVELIKGRRTPWPLAETGEWIMAIGSTRPLEDAYRIALRELVLWLERDYGFGRLDALQLISQAGENHISQIVDPNYTVVAKIEKKYLPAKK